MQRTHRGVARDTVFDESSTRRGINVNKALISIIKQHYKPSSCTRRAFFTPVCDSVHRRGGPCPGGFFVRGVCQGDPPYGKERAVRILLEWFLVLVGTAAHYLPIWFLSFGVRLVCLYNCDKQEVLVVRQIGWSDGFVGKF